MPRSRHHQRAHAIIPPATAAAAIMPTHAGASQIGKVTNGAAHTGAPVSPVAPASAAAKVNPSGPCTTDPNAAAWGKVSAARNTKYPAAPLSSDHPRRRNTTSRNCCHPRHKAAMPRKKMMKYAVSFVASIIASTGAVPYK